MCSGASITSWDWDALYKINMQRCIQNPPDLIGITIMNRFAVVYPEPLRLGYIGIYVMMQCAAVHPKSLKLGYLS